jgi:hypothetical protein
VATKSAPISSESGFSQLVTGSPAALPTGTRPDAMAPTTVPMKNGVSSDESPKSCSATCRPFSRRAVLWNAKPAPRSTMPSAARLSGMKSVEKIASNAAENPVQRTTSTKISQTWLASQTGPIAQSISSRARLSRPPIRLQNPAPKSAPPNTTYAVRPAQSTQATASAVLTAAPREAR